MESEVLKALTGWGPLGGVLVVVWFFIQYLKSRDQAQKERDAEHSSLTSRALDAIDSSRMAMTEMVTTMRSCRSRKES